MIDDKNSGLDIEDVDPAYRDGGTIRGVFTDQVPRDFHRSDWELRGDIEEQLSRHAETAGESVDVVVKASVATLRGFVRDEDVKEAIERIAGTVLGIEGVINKLEVKIPKSSDSGSS